MLWIVLVLLGSCLYGSSGQFACRPYERATVNLREVIVAACTVYQQSINQRVFCPDE